MRRPSAAHRRTAGLSLVEVLIAMALLTLVIAKTAIAFQSASRTTNESAMQMDLDSQARRVLNQVAYAVMSAERDALFPSPESPNFSDEITYIVSLGLDEAGELVWSDPENVSLSDMQQVLWRQNPGAPEERRVAWCNAVRPFLGGEIPNGIDDNGNGLIDEKGLTFTLDGNLVTIQLCLERQSRDGPVTVTVETVVTVRN